MTFRPSDDVLEELADSQNSQSWTSQYYTYNNSYGSNYADASNQWVWQQGFSGGDNYWSVWNGWTTPVVDLPVEEVKAPDLSDLILKSGVTEMSMDAQIEKNNVQSENVSVVNNEVVNNVGWMSQWISKEVPSTENMVNNAVVASIGGEQKWSVEQVVTPQQIEENNLDLLDSGKITDIERSKLVSWLEWSINWNLDFLVDDVWLSVIEKYKKIHRLLFKWWMLIIVTFIWILAWVLVDVHAKPSAELEMVDTSSIKDIGNWVENTSDKILKPLISSGVDIDVIVPYGSASIDGDRFQSKSNLVTYKWIVLPQAISINFEAEDFVSLKIFDEKNVTREDLKSLINYLIIDKLNFSSTKNFSKIKWTGNKFQWSLIDGFNLVCLDKIKATDVVCDQFLWKFYKYGKYYNLSYYADDLLLIEKELKKSHKDIHPICGMILEYIQRSWNSSSTVLNTIMEDCDDESKNYYRDLVNFITVENSLVRPELSDEVFDNADLNAYKLLSAQQSVYKFLGGTAFNESYIKSYLNFVQNLLNKDNGNNHYLKPIYKDMLYIFNNDELYPFLVENSYTNLKLQVDQINNGNPLYKYPSLLSQLTTPNLQNLNWDMEGVETEDVTIEDIFSNYYYMNDRLRIRKVTDVSEDKLKVQTELFTNKILSVTDWETLKLTVSLYRNGNVLYVSNIKVANQPKFTDVLNIYVLNWNVSFNAVLAYIDEQIGMWYQDPTELEEENPTFCEQIKEREDVSVYACDESSISLYKWEIEYNFVLENGLLVSFTIWDQNLNDSVKDKLNWVMFTKENTPTIIISVIDFTVELQWDNNIQKKLDIVDQFRIHFKMIPDDIHDIEWEVDEFLLDLTIWEFKLQATYNVGTHLLSKISYVSCGKILEIRWLSVPITTENESKLIEFLNNPRVFLTQANPAAYKKYQRMCDEENEDGN